jgi:5S rRNA maturation endonuclease (ribonuclease M5)
LLLSEDELIADASMSKVHARKLMRHLATQPVTAHSLDATSPSTAATAPSTVVSGAPSSVNKLRSPSAGKEFHVFLTHDWGVDEIGRKNHTTVTLVNDALKKRGLITWFDADRMEGQILDQMCRGIDGSSVVAVFITQNYMEKVYGQNENDNCKIEFNYAKEKITAKRMVAVPVEPRCKSPKTWIGSVSAVLGSRLYNSNFAFDIEKQPEDFERNIDSLVQSILSICDRIES